MAAENFKVKKGLEVGTAITATSSGVNVTGIVTATQFVGDGSGLTGVTGSGSGVVVKDEGSAVGTAGTINFVGSGVAATLSQGTATVTINSGGLSDVVADTTPQLGGNLDLNGKFINGTGGANITGVVTATTLKGNGDFVDIDVDGRADLDDVVIAGVTTFSVSPVVHNGGFYKGIINSGSQQKIVGGYISGSDTLRLGESMYLSSTGLGIGSASPTQKLDVNGSINATGNAVVGSLLTASGLDINGNADVSGRTDLDDLVVSGVGTFSTRIDTNGVELGTNTTTFAAKFADDAVANFGGGNDLQISHASDVSLIRDTRAGAGATLAIGADKLFLRNKDGNENYLEATDNGSVKLFFDFAPKFETTSHGVAITGVATATTFSGSGASLTNLPSAQLTGALPALDGSALTGVTGSGSGIIVRHDGSVVGTASSINFSTNLDVSAISAGIVTVTASGSSGVSLSGSTNNTVATVTGANALIGEANLTFDGNTLNITDGGAGDQKILLFGTNPLIRFKEGSTNKGYIQWHSSGYLRLTNEEDGSQLRIKDDIQFSLDGSTFHKVWHAGNDGASSGLDADLLDGQEGSYYTNSANLTGTIAAISGANLTTLNASELDSGTIPNGRFPATLPAVSGANLTSLNASEITSGTLPIARIANDAVTFAKMQNVGTGVFIGRDSSGTGDIETLTAAEARTLLNVADGATAGITTAPSNIVATWSIGGNSGSGYQFTGPGQDGSEGNPDIYLVRGQKYRFVNTTGTGHPFEFRNEANDADYTDGITGSQSGTQEFNVQHDAPAALKYRCTIHTGSMLGNIYIVGQHLANGVNNRVLTATSAYGMNGEANLTWDGNSLDLTAGTGNQFPIQIRNDFTPNSQRADYASLLNATSNNTLRLGSINSNGGATIQVTRGNDSSVKHNLILQPDGGSVRIENTNYSAQAAGNELIVGTTTGDNGITIASGNSGTGNIYFGDGDSNSSGYIRYDHNSNFLKFNVNGGERFRIDNTGAIVFNNTSTEIKTNTSDGSDNKRIILCGGGDNSQVRGAQMTLYGNEYSSHEGRLQLLAGNSGNDNGVIQMYTGGSEKLRIDSSGFVSIGRAGSALAYGSTNTMLEVKASDASNSIFETATFRGGADHNGAGARVRIVQGTHRGLVLEGGRTSNAAFGAIKISDQNGGLTESVHIDSSGTWFWGKTSQSSGTPGVELYKDGPHFMTRSAGGGTVLGLNDSTGTSGGIMKFYYQDVHRGSLQYTGSAFQTATASDYRLKENDTPISDGITRVKQLRPIRFNWKTDASKTYDGFIAHEVTPVVPEAVVGERDGEISERGEGYQMLCQQTLIPLLTAALKEEIAKREALEARIAALEGS